MNPSAREALEAERWECSHRLRCNLQACSFHFGVLHGIELAERADLERVVEAVENMELKEDREEWEDRHDWFDGKYDAIAAIRAAFPEVKDGEWPT